MAQSQITLFVLMEYLDLNHFNSNVILFICNCLMLYSPPKNFIFQDHIEMGAKVTVNNNKNKSNKSKKII